MALNSNPKAEHVMQLLFDLRVIISLEEIATRIGVNPDTVRKWYRQANMPTLHHWHKLQILYTEFRQCEAEGPTQ